MKKTLLYCLPFLLLAIFAFVSPVNAQKQKKEIDAFTKKFAAAYNAKDDKALSSFYTDDAVRVAADGTTLTGKEAIVGWFKEFYTENKVILTLKSDKVEPQADGSAITTGTYHLDGTNKAGEKLDTGGIFTNNVVKVNGDWKISKTVLTAAN